MPNRRILASKQWSEAAHSTGRGGGRVMRTKLNSFRPVILAAMALALVTTAAAQSTGSTGTPSSAPPAPQTEPQSAPGAVPVGSDTPATDSGKQSSQGTAPGT